MEIEIRAGFCDPEGELLAVLERSDWRRISNRRRGEIVHEMVRVCDETEHGIAEAWRTRDDAAWLERREAPDGLHAQRLTELVVFVQEMAHNVRGDALAGWLDGAVDVTLTKARGTERTPASSTTRCPAGTTRSAARSGSSCAPCSRRRSSSSTATLSSPTKSHLGPAHGPGGRGLGR